MQGSNVELDDVPELLDLTLDEAGLESPPLLLASVDELDFAEDELFVDEDETLLLDLSPLPSLVPSPLLRISLDEDSFSGSTKLLLSSSPQATNKTAEINHAAKYFTENLLEPQSFLPNLNYKKGITLVIP